MKDKAQESLEKIGEAEGIGDSPGEAFLLGYRLAQKEMGSDCEVYTGMLANAGFTYTYEAEDDHCAVIDVAAQGTPLGYAGFVSLHRFNRDGKLIAVGGAE